MLKRIKKREVYIYMKKIKGLYCDVFFEKCKYKNIWEGKIE